MPACLASLLGRLLLVPLALSGICFTMLFGAPVAQAQVPGNEAMVSLASASHDTTMVDSQDHAERSACCVDTHSEHEAMVSANRALVGVGADILPDVPRIAFRLLTVRASLMNIPPDRSGFSNIPLVGTTIKRE